MHTSVVMLVSKPNTNNASGRRGDERKRAGIAQRVKGRWKVNSRKRKVEK